MHTDARPHRRTWWKSIVAAVASVSLVATGAVATAVPAAAADIGSTVSGNVFHDYGSTGWYTEGNAGEGIPRNRPVEGVAVTAYDALGREVGAAQSAADGTYEITLDAPPASSFVRVEFSEWPSQYEPAFAAQGPVEPGTNILGDNNTSVQFVELPEGGAVEVEGVDFGLIVPAEVVQNNAPISTVIQYAGVPGAPGNDSNGLTAIASQPWAAQGGAPGSLEQRNSLATFEQVGPTWGLSYNPTRNVMLASSVLKRMAGFPENEVSASNPLGTIFRNDDVLLPDGSVNSEAENSGRAWFNVADLTVANGGGTVDLGTVGSNAERGLSTAKQPARDIEGFAKSARVGLGGIATSLDGSTLWVTNLNERAIYAIDITDIDGAPTSAWRVDVPVGADQQLWALTLHHGHLYVGVVDTGTTPGQSAAAADMNGYVYSIPATLAAPGATVTAGDWKQELEFDLGYVKGNNVFGAGNVNNADRTSANGNTAQLTQWNSWADTWTYDAGGVGVAVNNWRNNQQGGRVQMYPQPILSSIAFDVDGYMALGLADRTQIQSGNITYAAIEDGSNAFWETISSGEILLAAPAGDGFAIEDNGVVGDRTSTWPAGQRGGGNGGAVGGGGNGQGPGGGEFFNDRRNLGTQDSHREIGLGSVITYPGVDQIGSTVMDPLNGLYRSGLMWFDQRTGSPQRGFDQMNGLNNPGTADFQKGGGLGAVALVGVAAPVEIGNRTWLDADLNGRQDADEPAINGAVVELWTADADGNAVDLIGTTTTREINGQPGTYYFRSDDPELMAADGRANPFVPNADYVLVFKPGTGAVELAGPNATHAGLTGLTWGDLQLTTDQVRTSGERGVTDAANDSNPVPGVVPTAAGTMTPEQFGAAAGSYAITVGGPGENDHTYDAGWFGTNGYELEKLFDPEDVSVPAGTEYTFSVDAAENFRGQDRLTAAGGATPPGSAETPPGDPQVTEVTATVDAEGDWTWSSDQELPFGYTLSLVELGNADDVVWSTPAVDDAQTGVVTITPERGAKARASITAMNLYGQFSVTKTVVGDATDRVGDDVVFKVLYTIGEQTEPTEAWVSVDEPLVVSNTALVPGTEVRIKEADPIETSPEVTGVVWGAPTWTGLPADAQPDADGYYSFTIGTERDERIVELGLTNTASDLVGALSIEKARAAGEPLPDETFSFQYRVGTDAEPQTLGPIAAGESVTTTESIVYGSTVHIREIAPVDQPNVVWDEVAWSSLPAGGTGPDADGWYSFAFEPAADGEVLALTATNKATELFGSFTVAKDVAVEGSPAIDGEEFTVQYRTAPAPVGAEAPAFGDWIDVTLTDGETSDVIGDLPFGTIVQLREVQPVDRPGVAWGTPAWTDLPAGAVVTDGSVQFTVGSTDTLAFTVTNSVEETYGPFTLRKAFAGTGQDLVEGLTYPVDVQIGDGPVERIDLLGSGETWAGPAGLEIGTVVKVQEVTPLPEVDGIEWGAPTWAASEGTTLSTDDAGWTVFEITSDETPASLTVTNAPTQLFGQFQVQKRLELNGDPQVPADYTIEYTLDDGDVQTLTLAAGQTSELIGSLPFGTVVDIREQSPDAVAGVEWDTSWTIDGEPVAPVDGWVTFTVSAETTVDLIVTNVATQLFGQFLVAKTVTGDGADLVPADSRFWFEFVLNDGEPQRVWATTDEASEIIGGLPYGTVITITEVDFPRVPGVEFDAEPSWTVDGEPVTGAVTFTIDGETLVEVGAENTATRVYGTFELTKAITGEGAERVPDDASFTVEYSIDGGETWTALDTITTGDLTVSGPTLLVGTEVLLREVAPQNGADFAWGEPEFVVDERVQGADASFTIAESGEVVEIALSNPALPLNGTFEVTKQVTGDFALTDAELSDLAFEVNWSGGDREGTIVLDADGAWTGGPEGAPFPVGTQITLTEADVTGLPANVEWNGYAWAEGVDGVEISDDGRTATLTVATGDPARLVVTNEFTELTGTFGVEKVVEGDFALTDPELADLAFEVAYEASTGAAGTLVLDAAGEWRAALGEQLPAGTSVTLTEVAVDQTALPANVQWDGYAWVAGDGIEVSENGLVATVVIGDGTDAQLQVRNTFTELTGSFQAQKLVTGDFALTDPELSGLTFEVEYTASTGETGVLELTADGGFSATGPELPAGTTVELTERAPADLPPSVEWSGFTWVAADGVTVSEDGRTATITVATGEPVRLQVENTFTELTGTFGVAKLVDGDFALTDPELSGLTFRVPFTADNGAEGVLELNEAGEWVASGPVLPVGTVVTLTEAEVTGLAPHVQWGGYSWLAGVGFAVSEDGRTATLTIAQGEAAPQLELRNTFTELVGGFTVTKDVTGEGAQRVADDVEFVAEYSVDGGEAWVALPAMTKAAPVAAGPTDIRLGTEVLIREVAPAALPGVEWGTPAFSGTGVTPGVEGAPASFMVDTADTQVDVLLTNPTTPLNGQFQVTKHITGAGASLVDGDPVFTIRYSYEGQDAVDMTVRAGEVVSSAPIPAGTEVTIEEILPDGGLVDGARWGTPAFVLEDGTVVTNGGTITIEADTVLALELENPTIPPLAATGGQLPWIAGILAVLLLGVGGAMLIISGRRRVA